MEQIDDSALWEAKERADIYNHSLIPGAFTEDAYSQEGLLAAAEDYDSQLNLAGNGIMGYVEIPKISVNLPIYHGTENDSLERGIGHLLGSSLPVGRESTHSILSGHSGMSLHNLSTRLRLIHALVEMRTYLDKDETELKDLTDSAIARLNTITDAEFTEMDLILDFGEGE